MTPRTRKHLLLLAIAVATLLAVLHLQGCAAMAPEYRWTRAHPPAETVLWRKTSRDEMYRLCWLTTDKAPNLGGCAFWSPKICEVWSHRSEEEAKRTMSGDGLTLYEHEAWNDAKTVGHCAGFVHTPYARWQ